MSKKTVVGFKNIPFDVNFSTNTPITTNANQRVKFVSSHPNIIKVNIDEIGFNRNLINNVMVVSGSEPGTYKLNYAVTGDYTNEVLGGSVDVTIVNPETVADGFYNLNPAKCNPVIGITDDGGVINGNVCGFYTSDGTKNVKIDFNGGSNMDMFVIDPNDNVIKYTFSSSVTINANVPGIWRFMPAAPFQILTHGDEYLTKGSLSMTVDSILINSLYVMFQGFAFFAMNDCDLTNVQ